MIASLMGLLGRKGINGEYRVRVAVADDRQIGGKNKALDAPAVDDDAAGRIDLRRDLQNIVPKLAFHCRKGGLAFTHRLHLSLNLKKSGGKGRAFPTARSVYHGSLPFQTVIQVKMLKFYTFGRK